MTLSFSDKGDHQISSVQQYFRLHEPYKKTIEN